MSEKLIPDHGFTHGGNMHSDDVFSAAFLRILNPDIEIRRGNAVPEGYEGIIFDIGWGKFDHHQKDKEFRENGKPYAAFGLLWRAYGTQILCEEDAADFDVNFIQPLDYSDNTGEKNDYASMIANFNPTWLEKEADNDELFFEAVLFAQGILEREFKSIQARRVARERIEKMLEKENNGIFVMEEVLPWKGVLRKTDYYYVVYPSNRGGYSVQAVPMEETNDSKKPFPESWRGQSMDELCRLTGIDGFRFCHPSGFLCAAETLEAAMEIARQSLLQK